MDPPHSKSEKMTLLIPVDKDQKPFKCGLCSFSFDIIIQLDSHISEHSLTKPFQCGFCQASFTTSSELTVHVDTHQLFMCVAKGPFTENLQTKTKNIADLKVKESRSRDTKSRPVKGSALSKVSASTSKTQGISKQLSKRPLPVSLLAQQIGEYSCAVCGQRFNRVASLKKHSIAEHADDRPFHCEWCPSRFKQHVHLMDHVHSVHNKSCKPYVCPFCGDRFKIKGYLRHHVDRRHGMDSHSSSFAQSKNQHERESTEDQTVSISKSADVAETHPSFENTVPETTAGREESELEAEGSTLQENVESKGHLVGDRNSSGNSGNLEEDEALPHSFLTTSLGTDRAAAIYPVPQSSTLWNMTQDQLDMKVEMDFDSSSTVAQNTKMFAPENPGTTVLQLGPVDNTAASTSSKYQ